MLQCAISSGQTRVLTGTIQGENDKPLSGSSIIIEDSNGKTISYTISGTKGSFTLTYKPMSTPLKLTVSHIGYENFIREIRQEETTTNLIVKLVISTNILEQIAVKNTLSIIQKQDTLAYHVESFSKDEDRSIGDVLKRLPGITIDNEGAIYHNDKKIKNLYIQGDDLMAGKYGLATRAIKKEMIERIDVINNHQPIKVLAKKIITNDIGIDLVLKDDNTWKASIQSKIGLGIPSLYNEEVIGILLNRTVKSLNQIGINNTSQNYSTDLQQLGDNSYSENLTEEKIDIPLSLGLQPPHARAANNYYDNKSKVLNLNNLIKLNQAFILKINTQYLKDQHVQQQSSSIFNYVDTGIIMYQESFNARNSLSLFSINATVNSNRKSSFLNNTLHFDTQQNQDFAKTRFNDQRFGQNYNGDKLTLFNDFNWIPQISGRGVLEFRSYLNYAKQHKSLLLGEGYLPAFIDTTRSLSDRKYRQNISLPRFYLDNYISYKLYSPNVTHEYKVGVRIDKLQLESQLHQDTIIDIAFTNQSDWRRKEYYFLYGLQYQSGKTRLLTTIPFSYQVIDFTQKSIIKKDRYQHVFVLPNLNAQYDINGENTIAFDYQFKNAASNLQNLYKGKILQNFKNYFSNTASFDSRNSHNFDLSYKNEKPIQMRFLSIKLSYATTRFNAIIEKKISETGERYLLIPFSNQEHRYDLRSSFTKYFYGTGFTIASTAGIRYSTRKLLINAEYIPLRTVNPQLSMVLTKRFRDILEIRYTPGINYTARNMLSKNSMYTKNRQLIWTHDLYSYIKLFKFIQSTVNFNYIAYRQDDHPVNNFYLLDLKSTIPLKIKNNNTDLNLSCLNILNVKKYTVNNFNENIITNQQFNLRGRLLTFDLTVYF